MLFNVLSEIVPPCEQTNIFGKHTSSLALYSYTKNIQKNMEVRRNVFQISEIGADNTFLAPAAENSPWDTGWWWWWSLSRLGHSGDDGE